MDFEAQVKASLNTDQAKSDFSTFKNSIENSIIKIKLDVDSSKIDKSIQSTYTDAGKTAGKSYNTALQKQIETMARTQRNAFSEPLNNMTKSQKAYSDWWNKELSKQEKQIKSFTQLDATTASNKTLSWLKNNSKAAKDYGDILTDLANKQRLATSADELKDYTKQVNAIKAEATALGKTGKSFGDEFSRAFKQIGQFAGIYGVIQKVENAIISSLNELKNINTIVTEISKAADVPVQQLKDLETNSFSIASKYGQKASDYLLGVQEMTRAGYSDTAGMAELSTLAQSAGDMTAELANQYLIASDMAFGYGGNVEKLNALLDSQNQITNRNAVSLTELANATKLVASQAAQSGIAEDEMTAAISTMIATTQQGGEIAARSFKGILMNLQQVTGELDDGEVIDEAKLQKVEKRLTSVGVAMKEVKDGTVSLRDPMKVLEELAQVYNSLPDDSVEKAGIISDLGGKYRGNQLAALLSNWDTYKKILGDYQNAQGSAAQEAEKTANSWEGSINRLSNSWTDLVANFADSSEITTVINFLNGIVSSIDILTEKSDGLKSLFSIISGGFLTKNGLGKRNADLYKVKQNNRRFINVETSIA